MQTQLNTAENTLSLFSLKQPANQPNHAPQPKSLRTFEHQFDTYLKDSNAYTNVYFSRYFEWQGVCREHWFQREISRDMLRTQGVLITKCAHNDYVRETFPFQTVKCLLNTYQVKQCSFYMLFRFYENNELISSGYQQIVFADLNKRITKFPEFTIKKVRQFEITY